MFSPEATSQGTLSVRNPRRRPRNSSDEHTSRQSAKRRKRSSLTPSTFEPPLHVKTNGHVPKINGDHVAKENSPELTARRDAILEKTSFPVRQRPSRSEKEKKTPRHAEGIVLVSSSNICKATKLMTELQTKSDYYVVTKDPTVPSELHHIIRSKGWWTV